MAETSPDGRFRFVKEASEPPTAGTAYDTENGTLMGWNVLDLRRMSHEESEAARRSVDLLKRLNHSHVMEVHSSWDAPPVSTEQRRLLPWQVGGSGGDGRQGGGGKLVYLTTPCTTLEAFIQNKVEFLRWRVVKRWCRQVLDALSFLHRQPIPVVHKTLNLGGVYIDPSKSHLFVGGVEDIVPPSPSALAAAPPAHHRSYSSGGSHSSWGERAWGLVSGNGAAAAATFPAEAEDCGAGREAGAQDVRAFGALLIEIIIKKRLDPSLALDDQWVEMLLAVSGWPSTVVDLIGLCRAPVDERPSADQLLEHPFLELGNELDDEPINNHVDLVATAQAMMAAAAAGTAPSLTLPFSGFHPHALSAPPPLFAPLHAQGAGAGGAFLHQNNTGAYPYPYGAIPAMAGSSKSCNHPPSCPGCRGTGGWGTCSWSPEYAPSCVSTEVPSPSSPSTAPSFGGVPTTPSPPPARGAPAGGADLGWTGAVEGRDSASTVSLSAGLASTGSAGSYWSSGAVGGVENFLPPGVTPAALANATAIAAQIDAVNRSFAAANGDGGDRDAMGYACQGRIRAVSCTAASSSAGGAGANSRADGEGADVGSGGATTATRSRSASEDAVWDMLPSDERECRRPFTCSAVERRRG